jgi:hypothetical protein
VMHTDAVVEHGLEVLREFVDALEG